MAGATCNVGVVVGVALVAVVVVVGFAAPTIAYTTLQPAAAFAWWVAGNFTAVLDVRTQSEYLEGHILGAAFEENLAQAASLPTALAVMLTECSDCPLAAHCKSGVRSKKVRSSDQGIVLIGL